MLIDAKADMLIYGNAERPLVEVTHRMANGETLEQMQDIRGTAIMVKQPLAGWRGKDSTTLDAPGTIDAIINPYIDTTKMSSCDASKDASPNFVDAKDAVQTLSIKPMAAYEPVKGQPWFKTYAKLPSYDVVKTDPVMYAHASRVMHHETNPGSARALYQEHGNKALWVNPPAMPLDTEEMDYVFAAPFARVPHPMYGDEKIPAYDMIRFSVNIMRGCFGGCSFCSITEHEGRIIQNRSEDSIIREVEDMRDKVPGFTGVVLSLIHI